MYGRYASCYSSVFGFSVFVLIAANFACNANAGEVVDTTVDAEDTVAVVVVADAIAVVSHCNLIRVHFVFCL